MRRFDALRTVSFFLALAAIASSCSTLPKAGGLADARLVVDTTRQAQEQFALGRYRRALDIFSNAYDKNHHRGLRQGYARLGEQIRAAADRAYESNEFADAGYAYRILFESGITTRDFAASLSFDDDYLSSHIRACSKPLMEFGLMKYREEKLDEAIAIWKKILVFDIDNRSVKSAIDTATVQLQQLRTIK